ncbi:hypothetical protein LINPERHAP2_LOCUS34078 [Linum perenne]
MQIMEYFPLHTQSLELRTKTIGRGFFTLYHMILI